MHLISFWRPKLSVCAANVSDGHFFGVLRPRVSRACLRVSIPCQIILFPVARFRVFSSVTAINTTGVANFAMGNCSGHWFRLHRAQIECGRDLRVP